jgi:hypothetical protein
MVEWLEVVEYQVGVSEQGVLEFAGQRERDTSGWLGSNLDIE